MKLDNIIAVSGMPGLYKMLASRANGLLIENFDSPKRQFVSARKHQFTPLVSIGIYTYSDVVSLDDIFAKIEAARAENPLPDANEGQDVLRGWFKTIVPDHDEDRVHLNDIRKVIRWFNFVRQYAWEDEKSEE